MERKVFPSVAALYCTCRSICLFAFFQLLFIAVHAQGGRKVSGVVKDMKGNALSGVSVTVKGTTAGAMTDANGAYTITAPNENAILVFSLISYGSKEIAVAGKITVNVELAEQNNSMDDVVVIGYGTQKKRDVTGAISSINSKAIQERQPMTLADALQGQAAGVLVTTDNGDPAAQGTVQVRGASTLNSGNGPLYVIDGIISENGNFVNPADIETIDILKDASSTAIYGARGANGVIIITTKRGKEGKPMISANYYHLFGRLAHKLRTISAAELRYYRRMRGDGNNGGNTDSLNPYLNADNDYQDLLFRTAHKNVASLSIGGGQKGISYYGGLTYTDDQSIVINSWIKRLQSKINVSYQASPKLTISHSLAFAWQTGNNIPVGTTVKQVFERNPWTSIYRPDGSLAGYVESKRNPVAYSLLSRDLDKNYTVQFNTQMAYAITKDLKFTTLFNAQLDNNNNNQFSPSSLTSGGNGDATGSNTTNRMFYWEYQAFLNYNKRIGEHNISATLGATADRRRNDGIFIATYKYLSEEINAGNVGTIDLSTSKTGTTANAVASAAQFARLMYNYAGKYQVQAIYRRDGSSRFGAQNKWGNFYSGSVAWRFTDEKFMENLRDLLYEGRLRLSVGTAGNDRIGNTNYPWANTVNFGENYYAGYSSAAPTLNLGNSEIHWEVTTSKNIGIDLSFLKGRLNFTADYYIKNTSDLLYNASLAKETGKTNVNINLGSIRNTGLEMSVTGTPVLKKDFKWDASGNISFQRGKITELYNHTSFVNGKWLIQEGGTIGDFYVWKNLGVYQWNESNAYDEQGRKLTPVIGAGGTPDGTYLGYDGKSYAGTVYKKKRNGAVLEGGDTEWYDRNNDGIIDDQDKVIGGNAIPTFFFGLSSTITYKNITFSFLLNGQIGNKIYNSVANGQNTFSSTYSPPTWDAATTSWQKQGDISKYPYFPRKDNRGAISNGYNSLYIEDGSFIRLSSVRLAYGLMPKVAKKIGLRTASVYVYGNNLLMFTNYSWYDPEIINNNVLQMGDDNGRYPKRRELGIGVNVNF